MTVQQQVRRYGQRRLGARVARVLPWVGTAVALITLTSRIRRKGLMRGSADTALNAMPVVGSLKSLAEIVRGRDFFPDKKIVG
jgi:hypothetical protein